MTLVGSSGRTQPSAARAGRSGNRSAHSVRRCVRTAGQTGAGKSWSMMGAKTDPELKGIIPRAAEDIFARIAADGTGTTFDVSYSVPKASEFRANHCPSCCAQVTCSYLEVYREKIGDLLNKANQNLSVREHPRCAHRVSSPPHPLSGACLPRSQPRLSPPVRGSFPMSSFCLARPSATPAPARACTRLQHVPAHSPSRVAAKEFMWTA